MTSIDTGTDEGVHPTNTIEVLMPAKVTLTVSTGPLQGQRFEFAERAVCTLGRHPETHPRLPDDADHATVSRRHCLLDINPPDIRVRDYGSRNGTFVNGENIGQRAEGMSAKEGAQLQFTDRDLKQGDQLKVGNTVFEIEVFVPPSCTECSAEIADDQRAASQFAPGQFRCEICRSRQEGTKVESQPPKSKSVCKKCGRDIASEIGANRAGDYVCQVCQRDPEGLLKNLLALAKAKPFEFPQIQGYRFLKLLGKGGMGAVCLAQHEQTGQSVALKIMLPKVAANPKAKTSFLREIACTKSLRHPHVVTLHDSGCSEGTFFCTLEFCDGGSVDQLMKQHGGTLSIDDALAITIQALQGLEYAHSAPVTVTLPDGSEKSATGVVHRDLKPHNLFLSGSSNSRVVKVADFGLAKAFDLAGLSGLTMTGGIGGTLGFMPRQQIVNFKYSNAEVDVWAMAASLYYMLTGECPRDFPPTRASTEVVLNTDAIPIRQRKPSIPPKLAKVIDEALVDRPRINIKTASDFRRALEDAV